MKFFNGFRYFFLLLILSFALLIYSGPSRASEKELVIADHGITKYEIVIRMHATSVERYAATELATFLNKMTDATFQIKEVKGLSQHPFIMLSRRSAITPRSVADPAFQELVSDGFLIQTQDEGLIIESHSSEGILSGVYHFLEESLDCRWYSSDFMVIPSRSKVTIPSTFDLQSPRFTHREVFSKGTDDLVFSMRNRLNGQLGHRAERFHSQSFGSLSKIRMVSVHELVSPSKYARNHPEFFGRGQLRFGKPSVRVTALNEVLRKLARWPQGPYYLLISPADIETYYNKDEDKALIDAGHAPGAAFFDFVRVIADGVKSEYPEVIVLALAYKWSRRPPMNMELPQNMGIMLADIEVNFSKPLNSHGNKKFLHDLDNWAKLTNSIIIWDYITNFNGYIQPYPNFGVFGENLKILARWPQVKGVFEQGSYETRGGEFAELRAWVLSKLLWNPEQDDKVLIKQFLAGYYGSASPFMQDYLKLLEQSIQDYPMHLAVKVPPTAAYLSQNFLDQADQIFQEAEQAVQNEATYLTHVQAARIGIDYAILVNNGRFKIDDAQDGESRERYAIRYRRFEQYLKNSKVTAYREGGQSASSVALLKNLRNPQNQARPPEVCKNRLPENCIDFQDRSFRLAGDAKLVSDEMASDGSTARMSGNSAVWGIQLPLNELPPEGSWKVYFRGRIEEGSGKGYDIAFKVGIYPGREQKMTMNQMADKGYQEWMLPGVWTRDKKKYVWIAPPKSNAIKALYVDRIIIVRTDH